MRQVRFYVFMIFLFCCSDCKAATIPNKNTYELIGNQKCIDEQTGRELYVGDAFYRTGQCIRVQCLGDLTLWEDKCSVPNLEGDCVEIPTTSMNLPYPRCCPLYECQKILDNGNFKDLRVYDHYGNLILNRVTQLFTITQYDHNKINLN